VEDEQALDVARHCPAASQGCAAAANAIAGVVILGTPDGDLGDEYEAVEHYLNSEVNNLGGHKELADLAEALASLSGAFGEAADYWKGYTGQ
jgi:hypothetical protein